MTKGNTIIRFLLCTAGCVLFLGAASETKAASSSLYDSRDTVQPDSSMVSLFGPRAGGIRYDKRMVRAAKIAQERARAHSTALCWRYVKNALVQADVVDSRPSSSLAKQAGHELLTKYGFRKISVKDPYRAPVGAVLVYGGRGAGHVEIRTAQGFVSDFVSKTPSKRPLLGVYVKPV